ncbi:MAG: MOSC domain-containing protein [Deltaproteobacteria bacterium]|nr:MOSC domain-containing protein [Deltaproteobacteria bacterium]
MRLSSIVVYPIKSCGPIALDRAVVTRRGLLHDRRFMIVETSGRFVTQREEPRLTQVKTAIEGDALIVEAADHGRVETALVPDGGELGATRAVTVWRSTLEAPEVPALSAFFTRFLARDVACVAMTDTIHRAINPKHANEGDEVSFADGYPLLLASESSRRDLEARAGVPLVMARFRPNVVVEGATAWDEDHWSHVSIGGVLFRAPKPCARCVITTLDPETGQADKEPLKTLATFRRVDGEVMFGLNLVPVFEEGEAERVLEVGASVRRADG